MRPAPGAGLGGARLRAGLGPLGLFAPGIRVAAMLVVLVGLPTALLVAADLRELARDRAFVRTTLKEAHRTQAAALASDVASQLRRRLARLHAPGDPAEAARIARSLAEEKPFVAEPFWIDREARLNGVISLPAPGRVADLPNPIGGGDAEAAEEALREGARAEFGFRDRAAAVAAYRRALLLGAEPGARAHAAFALGRLAERAGKPDEAAPYYRAASQILGDGRDARGIPFGLIADLRLGAIAPDPTFIASLRARMAVALTPDESAAFGAYLTRHSARPIQASPPAPALLPHATPSAEIPAAYFAGGTASASEITSIGSTAIQVAERLWPLIRGKEFHDPAWVRAAGPAGPLLYGVAGSPRHGYVGFLADFEGIAASYVPRWEQRVGLDPAAEAALRVAGTEADPTRAGEVASGSLDAALEVPFEFARASIRLKEDAVDARLGAQARRSLLALGLLLAAIGAGAFALYRGITRELAFARMQAAFVAGVSHELKTPLTAIRMYADLLALGMAKDPQAATRTLVAEGDRLSRLIDRVLDFARIQRGTKTYNPARVEVAEVVSESLAILDPSVQEGEFRVVVQAQPEMPPVMADRDALLQVLLNLVSNAMKYSGASRDIAIRMGPVGEMVEIAVTDRGMGISKREQARIFEPFQRAVPANGPAGSGLGLALVREYVAANGGEIRLESEPGAGATFTVTWPVWRDKETGRFTPATGGGPGNRVKPRDDGPHPGR